MIEVLVVNGNNKVTSSFTPEEKEQRAIWQIIAEEQSLLDSLKPTPEEIKQAEFELNCLNLLLEVGLI